MMMNTLYLWLAALSTSLLFLSACANNGDNLPMPTALENITVSKSVTEQWRIRFGSDDRRGAVQLEPVLYKGMVIAAAASGDVVAVHMETGKTQWQTNLGQPISAGISLLDDQIAVATSDGQLHLLQAIDSSPVWRVATSSEVLAVPQANASLVLVQTVDGRITAYKRTNGELLWHYSSNVPSLTLHGTSTPIVDGRMSYAGFANGKLLAFDNQQGEVIWQQLIGVPMERLVDIDGPLQLVDGVLYVSGYRGHMTAIEALSGKIIWRQSVSSYRAALIFRNQVYVVADDDSVMAYERQNGDVLWRNGAFLHRGLSRMMALDDTLLVLDSLGYVHLLQQSDGAAVGRYKLGQSGGAVGFKRHGRDLYVLTQDGILSRLTLN